MNVRWFSRRVVALAAAALAVSACAEEDGLPPVVVDQTVTIDEDTIAKVPALAGASDPNGDPLTVTAIRAPGHTVTNEDGILTVIPANDFHGTVEVRYVISDGTYFVPALLSVVVRSINDAPVVADGLQQIHGPAVVMLSGSDVDGDTLGYEIVTGPAHGTLQGAPPDAEYVPDSGFVGDDEIVYRVRDAALASPPAALHLQVSPGIGPSAESSVIQVVEDTLTPVTLHGSDPDGNALTFEVLTPPAHGTLAGAGDHLIYVPAPDFTGDDALTFAVHNGYAASVSAAITLHVTPVNDAPVAAAQRLQAVEDTARSIVLTASDVEGAPLAFALQSAPQHGALAGSGAHRTYTPAPNFHGTDSFTFVVSDGVATSPPATVAIDVASVDDPPVAAARTVTVTEDTPATVTLTGDDPDGDPIGFAVTAQPAHGALSGTPPNLTYTPAAEFSGNDAFTFTVASGGATSAPATVAIHVDAVNDPPVAVASIVTTAEDTPVVIQLQASDVESTALSYVVTQRPSDGTLIGTGANRVYLPASNATGSRSLVFQVSDGERVASATVRIDITPVNDPPVAHDNFVFTEIATPLTFDVVSDDLDVDGDPLAITRVSPPAHGTMVIAGRALAYTPAPGFAGVEDLTYTIADGAGGSATAHAIIGVGVFPPGVPDQIPFALGGTAGTITDLRAPAISYDGRFVAFVSSLALTDDDDNGVADVFVVDRVTQARTRVSVSSSGEQGNAASLRPRISADGRYVVFESFASNLVGGDDNAVADVFRHDTVTGETLRISVSTSGAQGSGDSGDASVSDDGNLVVFSSAAFELVPDDANGAADVFLRDVAAGTTTRLSVSATGGEGDAPAGEPRLSGDGRFVAFSSLASNLVPGDSNAVTDVFVRDRIAGTVTRVSVSSTGGQADRACDRPAMSRDGRFVAFLSDATNLAPGATTGVRVYTHDAHASTTTRAAVAGSAVSASLSGDGRYLAIDAGGVTVFDRFAGGAITPLSPSTARPAVSGNGRYMAVIDTELGVARLRINRLPP